VFPIELNSVNLSFAPGETIKSITIPTYTWNERYYENRNFQLRCQQVGTSEFSTGNGTIIYKPNIKFSDNIPYPLTTNEGDLINLDVVVEGAILNETNVNYSISSDEAIDGVDFIDETGGSISFLPGENLKTISIRALDNGVGNRAKSIQVTLGPLTTNVDDVDILHSY